VIVAPRAGVSAADVPEGGRTRHVRPALLAGLVVLALGTAALYLWREPMKTASVPSPKSIAVLPFKPLVAESRDESLEMGMADTLITRLGNSREVIVRPLSSVRKYVSLEQDPQAAGRELGVESVLDGSIQRWGDQVRVTARLVSVADGTSLWAGTFDEKFTGIFAVQDSISERVASALSLHLTGDEKRRLTRHHTENAEAYRLYLTGRYFLNKRTSEGFRTAIEHFTQAIEKDPRYAPAYVGLADSYQLQADYDLLPPSETSSKAKAAALKALEIDDTLAEAHASLADILKFYDWNWAGAEREYRRAIELNPNYATAHQWYAEFLAKMGRHAEAEAEIKKAQELDPQSVVTHSAAGWIFLFAREYDRSIEECRKVIEMEPGYTEVYSQLRRAYEQKGMFAEALAADEKYRASRGRAAPAAAKGQDLRPAGAKDYWQGRLEVASRDAEKEVTTLRLAEIYAQIGEHDRAFEWLEKAYREHSFWMPYLKVHPHLDPLRPDPRFTDLLRRVGL
ncbi:MAG: tetratricopeptide repeat protein, partial [Pyrinomonadaceae bacterium]